MAKKKFMIKWEGLPSRKAPAKKGGEVIRFYETGRITIYNSLVKKLEIESAGTGKHGRGIIYFTYSLQEEPLIMFNPPDGIKEKVKLEYYHKEAKSPETWDVALMKKFWGYFNIPADQEYFDLSLKYIGVDQDAPYFSLSVV